MGLFSSIGSFFGSVGSVIGGAADGLLSMKSDKDSSKAKQQAAQQADQLNYLHQKEFAQNGIRWRVEDAKQAGLHPLAALGAQTPSYTPTFQSDAFYQEPTSSVLSRGLHSMGQNISRAKAAKMQEEDRALENAWKSAQIKRLEADTALSQAQASKMVVDSQQLPPAMPAIGVNNHGQILDGQPDSGIGAVNNLVKVSPSQSEANSPARGGTAAATVPDISFARTNDGGYALTRSASLADRMDDDLVGNVLWHFRNSIPQLWNSERVAPPKSWLPSGASSWRFDLFRGAWYPRFDNRKEKRKDFLSRSGSKY